MDLDVALIRQLADFGEARLPAFLDDLRTLVAIDSGTFTPAGVNRVVDWLAARAAEWGWPTERYPAGEYGDCLSITARGSGDAGIVLLGHSDTVFPPGTAAQRPLTIDGDMLHGPGACDMKSGLLAGLYAMRGLQHLGFDDFAWLTFFCNSDEEVGSPASQQLYAPLAAAADTGLAFESARANGDLVSARKGGGTYRIQVWGKSAHAGVEPEKGANAIVQMARLVDAAAGLNGLLPGVTVNPGIIRGGERSNVVPDYADCEVDVRACDAPGAAAIHQAVSGLAQQATVPGTRVEIAGVFSAQPMPRTRGNAWLAQTAGAIGQALGFVVRDGPMTGGMGDANHLAAAGLPVIDGLGPVGGLDHSPDEYLLVSSIAPRIALAAGLIATTCQEVNTLRRLRTGATQT